MLISSDATLATEPPARVQQRAAALLCLVAGLGTVCLMPLAARTSLSMPGFMLVNETALVITYALSAWVLFAQFQRGRSPALLVMAAGTLYTAAIVFLQFLSVPGVVAVERILGSGSETTTWLWTFWHVGPPACALAYAALLRGSRERPIAKGAVRLAAAAAAILALVIAALAAIVATLGLPWLPHQVSGDDYTALVSSGVGPMVQLFTVVALASSWHVTRGRRTVLELWIAVSLALLVMDNLLTMAGGARSTVGWYAGRIEALISAFVVLWAYLHEVDTLRARAEGAVQDLTRAETALRQAQKMEAVGRLTGGIAHDFNNLLMVVTNAFEMIQRRPDDRARVLKSAATGLGAAQRGGRLTRQLLTFARRQNMHPETINANALLLDFEPLARRAVGEVAKLNLTLDPALHPAQVDRGEFEAAMLNLVVNARDAVMPQNGHITISTRNEWRETVGYGPQAEPILPGIYVVVSVADNGTGMDADTQDRVFEPFFTTKEFGKGSGLGLSQVYGFARTSGGTVFITSKPEQGTTVEMWLPRTDGLQPTVAQVSGPASALRRAENGEVVLAVEDDPEVLAAVVENLADLNYQVIAARDAAEALEQLRTTDRVDVLFSDVVMPGGMNGVQLAVEARRLCPELRVLLTSGYTGEALAGEHGVPGNVPVLTKPYRCEELAKHLKLVVGAT